MTPGRTEIKRKFIDEPVKTAYPIGSIAGRRTMVQDAKGIKVRYMEFDPEKLTGPDVDDINTLLRQLTDNPKPMNLAIIAEVASQSMWLVVRDVVMNIRGMAVLTISRLPTGRVGHIDDVVVHRELRGQNVGEELMKQLIHKARHEFAVDWLELTCRPDRVEANKLYEKLGFVRRDTNCWTFKF